MVVPRDGADPERIMNHSSILRKYKVSGWVHVWPGEAVRGLAVSLHRGGTLLSWDTRDLRLKCSQLMDGMSKVGRLERHIPALKGSLHSCFPPSPAEQHPGGEGRLKPPHVSCQLHQKQVGEAGLLPLQSRERGVPSQPLHLHGHLTHPSGL